MRIPSHIKWIALIFTAAFSLPFLICLTAFLYMADIIPWPSKPESHAVRYEKVGTSPPSSGYVWSYGGAALADPVSYYRLPLDGLPRTDLQNAPLANAYQLEQVSRWWGAPQEGSRILIIEERVTRYEMIWDPAAKAVFLSIGSSVP